MLLKLSEMNWFGTLPPISSRIKREFKKIRGKKQTKVEYLCARFVDHCNIHFYGTLSFVISTHLLTYF